MRHTASREVEPELAYICDKICQLEAGQRATVSRSLLRAVSPRYHNDCRWQPPDRVLSNIIGSKYTLSYFVAAETGDVTFERHEDNGQVRYKEPDDEVRLNLIRQDQDMRVRNTTKEGE